MPNNLLVTGKPGSGKTTLVVRLAQGLAADGFKAAGFVTEEIREGSVRRGFKVRELGGNEAVLAHVDYKGKPRVGRYGVDVRAFEGIALQALRTGKEADLLVVDEIGRMEMASSSFRSALVELMDSCLPVLATIHMGKDDFTTSILERGDITLYHVATAARDGLLEVIGGAVREMLADKALKREPEGGKRS